MKRALNTFFCTLGFLSVMLLDSQNEKLTWFCVGAIIVSIIGLVRNNKL